MKKLYLKGLLFCSIILSAIAVFLWLSVWEPTRLPIARWAGSEDFMSENEMLPYFERAGEADGTTVLIIGDSIANQLFSDLQELNPQASILATNATLLITGQYLLAEEYLKSHPDATDVFLLIHPVALTRGFDARWGYRNAVMTYVETGTVGNLDKNTRALLSDVYGPLFLKRGTVSLIEASPVCRKLCLSYLEVNREAYVPEPPFELADQYVRKLYDLCRENRVELHFYSCPVSEYFRDQVTELSGEYGGTWMSAQFPDYFAGMMFYPAEWAADSSHFSGEHAGRGQLNEIIRQAYGQTGLEGLKLE